MIKLDFSNFDLKASSEWNKFVSWVYSGEFKEIEGEPAVILSSERATFALLKWGQFLKVVK